MAVPFIQREPFSPEQQISPQIEDDTLASVHDLHPPSPEGVLLEELYQPIEGQLTFDKEPRNIPRGTLEIGIYESKRASRRIGLYTPHLYNPDLPPIFMDTPLMTSAAGHNDRVARRMMAAGFQVALKGPPRYPGMTLRGMPITEDANETLMFERALRDQERMPDHNRMYVYGESQAAMKGLAIMALAQKYDMEVEEAQIVAACFYDKINWLALPRNMRGFGRMISGTLRVAREIESAAIEELKGTINHKDFHHHAVVVPRLTDGSTGQVIPLIDRLQPAHVIAFDQDVYSHPQRVEERFEEFPDIEVNVMRGYGHVDGIMSDELAVLRGVLLYETAKKYD